MDFQSFLSPFANRTRWRLLLIGLGLSLLLHIVWLWPSIVPWHNTRAASTGVGAEATLSARLTTPTSKSLPKNVSGARNLDPQRTDAGRSPIVSNTTGQVARAPADRSVAASEVVSKPASNAARAVATSKTLGQTTEAQTTLPARVPLVDVDGTSHGVDAMDVAAYRFALLKADFVSLQRPGLPAGEVKFRLQIRAGQPTTVLMVQGSGHASLDRLAWHWLNQAVAQTPYPHAFANRSFDMEMVLLSD